jgi:hypothetical protein
VNPAVRGGRGDFETDMGWLGEGEGGLGMVGWGLGLVFFPTVLLAWLDPQSMGIPKSHLIMDFQVERSGETTRAASCPSLVMALQHNQPGLSARLSTCIAFFT